MSVDQPDPSPEREQTDESLRDEREKSDRALAEGRNTVTDSADQVLRRARQEADAVLLEARDKADLRVQEGEPPLAPSVAVARERVAEDAVLQQERAAADTALEFERAQAARVLAQLPSEREQTDQFLLIERVRSDDALASRDDFLGLVSHDLRDLLAAIVMSAAVVEKTAAGGAEGARILTETTRIQRNAVRMNRLIGDLLDVASIDAGRLAIRPQRGDLGTVLAEAVDAFTAAATAKGVRLTLVTADEPLLADFDHARLFQVLGNLIMNSIKFCGTGGSISVQVERDGESWRCSVTDTGIGIPADSSRIVFERVSQVGRTRSGLGLGLYISKCIVEAHGGRIWAESTLGAGSCVSFSLPRAVA